ncbi:hypothetical protein [Caproicibacter sp. BJN0012]|uniref:hypothetical protein n=1 Tax=Caproicibacter sp. BJN0012 TaxID=3110227 RepID=UPI002E136036
MLTKSIKVDETVLGEIQYYEMPFPDVYFMSGKRNEGYVVPKDYNGKVLSQKALAFGVEYGDLLFFLAGAAMNIVDYELLKYRLVHSCNNKEKEAFQEKLLEFRQMGQIDISGYFGAYPPPNETPVGIVEGFIKVCNGVYFAKSDGKWLLGISDPIEISELSIVAQQFGTEMKDYWFYDSHTSAIPVFELADYHEELHKLIVSEPALHTFLCRNFPVYVADYNADPALERNPIVAETAVLTEALQPLNFPNETA